MRICNSRRWRSKGALPRTGAPGRPRGIASIPASRRRRTIVTVHIVLFRGVGGATQLPTRPLAAALTEAGFGGVRTYIASGNVVLASDMPVRQMRAKVAEIAAKDFG